MHTPDKRCTYRIKKVPYHGPGMQNFKYKYIAQYKPPNGWFWRTLPYSFAYEGSVVTCNDHAVCWTITKAARRPPIYINLGKLP